MHRALVIFILIVIVVMLGFSANYVAQGIGRDFVFQGSGQLVEEMRTPASLDTTVDRVRICCNIHTRLEQGEPPAVRLRTDDNIIASVEVYTVGDTLFTNLVGRNDLRTLQPSEPISLTIRMPAVRTIQLTDASRLEAAPLAAERLQVEVSGTSQATLADVEAGALELIVGGTSTLTIGGGRAQTASVVVNSSAKLLAGDLAVERARVRVGSAGNATLWIQETLQATVDSGGVLRYYGTPQVQEEIASGGALRALGEK